MSVKDTIFPFEMTEFDAADFDGTYQAINEDGFPFACVVMRIVNDCDSDIMISWNGVTNHEFIEAGEKSEHYFQISNRPGNAVSMVPKGTVIHVVGPAQSTGTVYLMGYYRPQA